MNTNTIVLGKYAMNEALAAVVARAALFSDDKTVIIVKAEDDAPYSPYVVRHARHMMGDVCDVLWEAAKLSPDMPLLLASSRGYRYDFTLPAMLDGADLAIFGDEAALSGFKFDLTGLLIESGALPGSALFRLYFKTTKDYLDLTERVILAGKIQGEAYELRTVINQAILDGKKIVVRSWEDLP